MLAIFFLTLLTIALLALIGAGVWTMKDNTGLGIVMTITSAFLIYAAWHVHYTPGTTLRDKEAQVTGSAPKRPRVCLDESHTATGTVVCNRYGDKK